LQAVTGCFARQNALFRNALASRQLGRLPRIGRKLYKPRPPALPVGSEAAAVARLRPASLMVPPARAFWALRS